MNFSTKEQKTGELILLRHGESEANRDKIFAGWLDSPLSKDGIIQAQKAGEILRRSDFKPDAVFSSTLSRATDTARNVL